MTLTPAAALAHPGRLYGLNPYEDALCRAWLRDWQGVYDSIELQAHVGGGIDPGPPHHESMRRMYRHNSQKRVDVLARGPFGVTICEIKPTADLAQVGQLIGYRWLWVHEHPDPTENVTLVALAFEALEDVAHVMRSQGVQLLVYPRSILDSHQEKSS